MSERIAPHGLVHELRYFRGWLAWLFVVNVLPSRWIMSPLARPMLPWAGYYAYDDRHGPNPNRSNRHD